MKKEGMFSKLITLFFVFMKVGFFTFGGGYAMIPIIEDEVSKKKKWITEMEIMDIIAIGESTPGPIAVNTATYVGYKVAGIWGGIIATLGLTLPSFLIILLISFFYKDFIKIKWLEAMFKGLKIGVIIILFRSLFSLKKSMKISIFGVILFCLSLITMLLFTFFNVKFNYLSLCLIALGLITGIVIAALTKKENKQ